MPPHVHSPAAPEPGPAPEAPKPSPLVPRLTIACGLAAFGCSVCYSTIYYAILRTNFLHPIVSMDLVASFAARSLWMPHLLSVFLAFFGSKSTYWARRGYGWRIAGVALPLLALPAWLIGGPGLDRGFGTREYQSHRHFAHRIAEGFRQHGIDPETSRTSWPGGGFGTFVDLAADLPASAASSPGAAKIVVAIDVVEVPDTGVVLRDQTTHQWVYYCHSRIAAFADGHVDLVPIARLPGVWDDSNAHRAALGLAPLTLPPGRPLSCSDP